MDLVLERGDLLQLDPISNRGTLKLLPVGKKNRQKLVIGDDAGFIGCYEFLKGDTRKVFVARPFPDGRITSIALGTGSGALNAPKDEIVGSSGQTIVRITKKGKELNRMTSSRTEQIHHIASNFPRIWMGCECIYSFFDNSVESDQFHMARHTINCMLVDRIAQEYDFEAALGCQDDCIRIIRGSECILEIPTDSPVTALAISPINDSSNSGVKSASRLLYGTENGTLALVTIARIAMGSSSDHESPPYTAHWSITGTYPPLPLPLPLLTPNSLSRPQTLCYHQPVFVRFDSGWHRRHHSKQI